MNRITTYRGKKAKYLKILFWGPYQAGKTTLVDTLYRLTKEQNKDVVPVGTLTKIKKASGATLYFDRGVFREVSFIEETIKQEMVIYHVWTVAGIKEVNQLRKKIFKGTDGVIFVFNSLKSQLTKNIESLKELKEVAKGKLVKKIPLIIMLNKQDLIDTISNFEVEQILREEGLMFESEDPLYIWNPVIFETIGLYDKQKNVYEAFMECAYRTKLHVEDRKSTKTARINLTLTEDLKNEWEIFARDILNKSLSQMIRDAVREYRNKYEKSEQVPDTIETKIEKIISEKMEKFMEKFKLNNGEEEKKYYEVDPYSEFIDLTMKWKELNVKLMKTKDPEENRKFFLQLIGISERMKNMTEDIYKKDKIRLMELEGLEYKKDKDAFKNLNEQIDKLSQERKNKEN